MSNLVHEPAPARAVPYELAARKRLPDVVEKLLFGRPLAPSPDEWSRVLGALHRGDPPMDRVVRWMFDESPGNARALFEQALTHGIGSVEDPPAPLRELFDHVDRAPAWLDRELLTRGAATAQAAGLASFYVLRDVALLGGYARFNSMNQTLAATGALTKDVALRLAETGKWLDDVTRPGGLERTGVGFISTIRVRLVHALVRRALTKRGDWDAATWGVPINQMDLLATYLGFGPVLVIGARLFGVPIGREDSRAAMHLWRYIGWLSGVEEQWLALTERDGLRKLHHASLTHYLPDEKIRQLGTALLDEPLGRPVPRLEGFPRLDKLVRRYRYHKHLSCAALVLGWKQRRRLGMPLLAVPWYPLLSAPVRFGVHCGYRLGGEHGRERLRQRGAAKQRRLLASFLTVATLAVSACGHAPAVDEIDAGLVDGVAVDAVTPRPVGCVTGVSAGHHLFACDGGIRYDVEIPDACALGGCGLVLDLHGLTMNATQEDAGTAMRARGHQHGYVVVQPNAPGVPSSWDQATHAPPVFAFVRDVADALLTDPSRAHVTGFSQGGGMTWRLICDHADFFASAAPLSGLPGCAFSAAEAPSREVPIMQVHGHLDTILAFGLFAIPQRDAALAYWQHDAGVTVELDGHTVTRHVSPSGTPFEFWEHDDTAGSLVLGGHCFPGGTDIGPSPLQFGCADDGALVVGERVMQFFLDHPLSSSR